MATRFYYVAFAVGGVPDISPGFEGTYEDTSQAVRRNLSLSKNATTETLSGTTAGDNGSNALVCQLISPPVQAQTISGTISIGSRGREVTATDNLNQRLRMAYIVNSAGTFMDTLLAHANSGASTELSTTMSAQRHAATVAITSQNTNEGDRIVIEYGYGETTIGSTPQWQSVLGGNGTDQTNTDNDTTGSTPWTEFSMDIAFISLTTPSQTPAQRATRRMLVR